jgi:alpha-glucosidase
LRAKPARPALRSPKAVEKPGAKLKGAQMKAKWDTLVRWPERAAGVARWSSKGLLATLVGGIVMLGSTNSAPVVSPDGRLKLTIVVAKGRLQYDVTFRGAAVIESSPLGLLVDGVDLGQGVEVDRVEQENANETYPWRGVHSVAMNHYNGARIFLRRSGGTGLTVEARVFNDGVTFRSIVPRVSNSRVPDAATSFVLPPKSTVWYHGLQGHYEGIHTRKDVSEVQADEWVAPPLTFQLANGAGYGSITEAALVDYAGMALQADGHRGFRERLAHVQPLSYEFSHHRDAAEASKRVARPAAITGVITTPWRVILVGADLNALVNSDVIPDLCPTADATLFPRGVATDWLKPGRAVWRFMDGGGDRLEDAKEFSRLAGELGFEYNLVEPHWRKWTDEQIRELVDYSRRHNVRILLWIDSRDLKATDQFGASLGGPATRRSLFKRFHELGVAGIKVDFIDNEAREFVDFYNACLRDAAEFQLVVDFHGANKPTGGSRTWPNELTREGIYGLEQHTMPAWAQHNTTLPFTRFLAGPADYTPVIFTDRRRETSWAHQIATAAIFTSPLQVYGAQPQALLENPAVEMIKSIPSVWDETIVLPMSEIGAVAAFARRAGDTWFLAILNGPEPKKIDVSLSFLRQGQYRVMVVKDREDTGAAVAVERATLGSGDSMPISLRPAGGFIARFSR